jgi:hypothetical protein
MIAKANYQHVLDPASRALYQHAMRLLLDAKVPFLVGGAYSFARHTGIERHTKDFDVFVRPEDCQPALDALAAGGFQSELTFEHWLGKAYHGDNFIDVIFSSGNGVARVDEAWFEHAIEAEVFDIPVRLCPVEETIWSKSFVMERERYDGADIAHLLRAAGHKLDWNRLLWRFGSHWRLLLSYLVLFGFIYPSDRNLVPAWVLDELMSRLARENRSPPASDRVCQGTLMTRAQFLVDIERWGYEDARLRLGTMSEEQIETWTAGIDEEPAAIEAPCGLPSATRG